MKELRVAEGGMLAAWPDLLDPNFMHSVVLICRHTEDGAVGLVVNRATEFTVASLFPRHELLGNLAFPVHLGGPVDHGTMQFVHTVPEAIPGGLPLVEGLWLGGTTESLARYLADDEQRALRTVRLFLGYSGWGEGQLESELSIGSWVPVPTDPSAVFADDGERTWRRVVASVDGSEAGLPDLPPDVSWN